MDKLDNRKENLRVCSKSENMRNRDMTAKNTSGYKGVSFDKRDRKKKWYAQIRIENRHIILGYFYTPEEAARAYNDAAIKYFGEFARINIL